MTKKKSKELTNFENKIKYLVKDFQELGGTLVELFKRAWYLGFDIAKAIVQLVSVWEMIPNLPEVLKIGKYVNKVLDWFKMLKMFK